MEHAKFSIVRSDHHAITNLVTMYTSSSNGRNSVDGTALNTVPLCLSNKQENRPNLLTSAILNSFHICESRDCNNSIDWAKQL